MKPQHIQREDLRKLLSNVARGKVSVQSAADDIINEIGTNYNLKES
jgi:hypothetical protein